MNDLTKYITDAITTGQNLGFPYQGLTRMVTPYLLGETNDGRLVLHGFQFGGESSRGPIETPEQGGWRFFYLNELSVLNAGPGQAYPLDLAKAELEVYKAPKFISTVLALRPR